MRFDDFGNPDRFFRGLRERRVRQRVAHSFGLDEVILASFVVHLNTLRNAVAHHDVLWNRRLNPAFRLPHAGDPSLVASLETTARTGAVPLYNTLVMLVFLSRQIPSCVGWEEKLKEVLRRPQPDPLPMDVHAIMGFPVDWRERAIWQ